MLFRGCNRRYSFLFPPVVRTKAVWELFDPTPGSERPARRTGHTCIAFSDRIIVYDLPNTFLYSTSNLLSLVSEALMASTTTMIHGPLILRLGGGQSCNVSGSFHRHAKVMPLLLSTTSSMSLAVVALMGKTSAILRHLRSRVSAYTSASIVCRSLNSSKR